VEVLDEVPNQELAIRHQRIAAGKIDWVLEANLKHVFGEPKPSG
jgi:hypothetical protein